MTEREDYFLGSCPQTPCPGTRPFYFPESNWCPFFIARRWHDLKLHWRACYSATLKDLTTPMYCIAHNPYWFNIYSTSIRLVWDKINGLFVHPSPENISVTYCGSDISDRNKGLGIDWILRSITSNMQSINRTENVYRLSVTYATGTRTCRSNWCRKLQSSY